MLIATPDGARNYHSSVTEVTSDGGLFDRVWTVPNALSVVRLALLPVFVSWMADGRIVAGAWFFGALCFTDFVDGWIARRFDQGSELGKVLDPVADRTIFFVGVVTAMWLDAFPVWLGVLILFREGAIALMMVGATLLGMERFPVTKAGKWAAFLVMCTVGWLTLGSVGGSWTVARWMGWAAAVPGMALSYWTLLQYVPLVRAHLAAGRAAKRLP
jgi:cardiolipin synthase